MEKKKDERGEDEAKIVRPIRTKAMRRTPRTMQTNNAL